MERITKRGRKGKMRGRGNREEGGWNKMGEIGRGRGREGRGRGGGEGGGGEGEGEGEGEGQERKPIQVHQIDEWKRAIIANWSRKGCIYCRGGQYSFPSKLYSPKYLYKRRKGKGR